MGVKFQAHPGDESSQVIIHVRMLDATNTLQQEALGIVGVNLVYGACYYHHDPAQLMASLVDGLGTRRLEIDMIEFSGIEFRNVDNRLKSLKLVELGLTDAAMFSPAGEMLQPSNVLRKRPILVERGTFNPVTDTNIDILDSASRQFGADEDVDPEQLIELMEITMHDLTRDGEIDHRDFLARADLIAAAGKTVLISNYFEYYRLAAYLSRYTDKKIALTLGATSLLELFDEKYYSELDGGILEAFGRLFKNDSPATSTRRRMPKFGRSDHHGEPARLRRAEEPLPISARPRRHRPDRELPGALPRHLFEESPRAHQRRGLLVGDDGPEGGRQGHQVALLFRVLRVGTVLGIGSEQALSC